MLTDHRILQERWASEWRHRKGLPRDYGKFIEVLADWNWFVTLTLTKIWADNARDCGTFDSHLNHDTEFVYPPQPPVQIMNWLREIEVAARQPIGWVLAEEFGRQGGRWHCHLLITGVRRVYRKKFWSKAFRRFGQARIEPYDPTRSGARYIAKYAGRLDGRIHFGGTLAGVNLSHCEQSRSKGGCQDSVRSVPLSSHYYSGSWARRLEVRPRRDRRDDKN